MRKAYLSRSQIVFPCFNVCATGPKVQNQAPNFLWISKDFFYKKNRWIFFQFLAWLMGLFETDLGWTWDVLVGLDMMSIEKALDKDIWRLLCFISSIFMF